MNRQIKFSQGRTARALAFAVLPSLAVPTIAFGDKNWNTAVADGSWNDPANWLEGAVPAEGDNVNIFFADAANHDIVFDGVFSSNTILAMQNSGVGTVTFAMPSSNALAAGTFEVGTSGNAIVNQAAGAMTISGQLRLAGAASGRGTYNLDNGTLTVADGYGPGRAAEMVGENGRGTFSQSGGSHTVGSYSQTCELAVGAFGGASGTYLLSGGTLSVSGNVLAGRYGSGTFIQSGGTCNAGSQALSGVGVGVYAGSSGTYLLSGGTLIANSITGIGAWGVGYFEQTGGRFYVGSGTGGFALGTQQNGAGTYVLHDGLLDVRHPVGVGLDGTGTFIQTGGTNSNLGLVVGSRPSQSSGSFGGGTYSLSGSGVLNVIGSESVGWGAPGVFIQSGGTHTAGGLTVGQRGTGTFLLSGGRLNSGTTCVGSASIGHFEQTGGLHRLSRLNIGSYSTSARGSYSLSGNGVIEADGEYIGGGGAGTFIQSGGTNNVSLLHIGTPDYYGWNSPGTYILSGGSLVGGRLRLGGDSTYGAPAGTLSITGGTVTLTGACAVDRNGTILYSGGTFSAGGLYVDPGGKVLVTGGGNKLLHVQNFSVSNTGLLDLTDNSMILDYYSAGSLLTNVRSYLGDGRLISSMADTGMSLGYADNSVLQLTSFGGYSMDATSLLIKYTYLGDTNLDGQVTVADLGALAASWQSTSALWSMGDFNYDGQVTISDLGDLASNWQAGVSNPLNMSFQQALAAVGFADALVPEPATVMALTGLAILRRRRRFGMTVKSGGGLV